MFPLDTQYLVTAQKPKSKWSVNKLCPRLHKHFTSKQKNLYKTTEDSLTLLTWSQSPLWHLVLKWSQLSVRIMLYIGHTLQHKYIINEVLWYRIRLFSIYVFCFQLCVAFYYFYSFFSMNMSSMLGSEKWNVYCVVMDILLATH